MKQLLERKWLAGFVLAQPLPFRPVPALVGLIDLPDTDRIVAEFCRVIPLQGARLLVELAAQRDHTDTRHFRIARLWYRDIRDNEGHVLAICLQSQSAEKLLFERFERDMKLLWLQYPQRIVFLSGWRILCILVAGIDSRQQRFDARSDLDPDRTLGVCADFNQSRLDHIGNGEFGEAKQQG